MHLDKERIEFENKENEISKTNFENPSFFFEQLFVIRQYRFLESP